jgi:hypothetical protein
VFLHKELKRGASEMKEIRIGKKNSQGSPILAKPSILRSYQSEDQPFSNGIKKKTWLKKEGGRN